MRNWIRQSIAWVILLALAGIPPGASAQPSFGWLAYGDFRGQFEPCGCDPRTDLGGIQRLAGFIERERALDPHVVLLDLGNNISPPHQAGLGYSPGREDLDDTQGIKDRHILEALVRLNPTAMLPGTYELARQEWMTTEIRNLTKSGRAGGTFPWVLSNLRDNSGPDWLRKSARPFIRGAGVAVYGFAWEKSLHRSVLSATSIEGKKRLAILARNPDLAGLHKIMLFSGPDEQLKAILKLNLFDEVIAGNRAPDSVKPDLPDRANEDRSLLRLSSVGVRVLQTQLGGQGVLRGGKAMRTSAPTLESLIAEPTRAQSLPAAKLNPIPALTGTRVSWLERNTLNPDVWAGFFRSYEETLRASSARRAQIRLGDLATSPFAGSQACKGCHAGAYDSWVKSRHSNAFAVLIEKGKNHDGECVSCHVLGATEKGGFVSQEASPQFMNVQCENCHGPRKEHALNPALKPRWIPAGQNFESLCTGCHHPPHSPDFDYKRYWGKIAHGLEE